MAPKKVKPEQSYEGKHEYSALLTYNTARVLIINNIPFPFNQEVYNFYANNIQEVRTILHERSDEISQIIHAQVRLEKLVILNNGEPIKIKGLKIY